MTMTAVCSEDEQGIAHHCSICGRPKTKEKRKKREKRRRSVEIQIINKTNFWQLKLTLSTQRTEGESDSIVTEDIHRYIYIHQLTVHCLTDFSGRVPTGPTGGGVLQSGKIQTSEHTQGEPGETCTIIEGTGICKLFITIQFVFSQSEPPAEWGALRLCIWKMTRTVRIVLISLFPNLCHSRINGSVCKATSSWARAGQLWMGNLSRVATWRGPIGKGQTHQWHCATSRQSDK